MHAAMSVNLHIEDYQRKPFSIVFYLSVREIYVSVRKMLSRATSIIITIIALALGFVTSPIWATTLYFLLLRSRYLSRKSLNFMKAEWGEAPRSEEMFELLESTLKMKKILERDGQFKMPRRFFLLRPFFIELRKSYRIMDEQADWLENKVYPTAEELGIPPEDVEFMRSQMTAKDYKDLEDPDWFEFEKECILN